MLKIISDEEGNAVTTESNIWTLGGDGEYTYSGLAIKPAVLNTDVTVNDVFIAANGKVQKPPLTLYRVLTLM